MFNNGSYKKLSKGVWSIWELHERSWFSQNFLTLWKKHEDCKNAV